MQTTSNYSLKKPDGTDPVDIADFNENANIIDAELKKRPTSTGNASDMVTGFSQASARANLVSGEALKTTFGKIMKWFTDLKTGAFATVANNDTTTAAGYVADARIIKVHRDEIDALKKSVSDGKKKLASTFTAKGVPMASDAAFDTMNTGLGALETVAYNKGVNATKKGTATAGQVLTGYTFTNASGVGLSGSMPNRGALNWNPGGATSYAVPAGYYSGGTLNSTAAYNKGVADADNRPNGNSVNYVSGYNAGVAAADNRVNPDSVNFQTGYNTGKNDARALTDVVHSAGYASTTGTIITGNDYITTFSMAGTYIMVLVIHANSGGISTSGLGMTVNGINQGAITQFISSTEQMYVFSASMSAGSRVGPSNLTIRSSGGNLGFSWLAYKYRVS